jgi:hypothetical protein
MTWEYQCDNTWPSFANPRGRKDKNDNWRAYDYQRPNDSAIVSAADLDAGMYLLPEERLEKVGAKDLNGSGSLENKTFAYSYGSSGQTPRAYEQLQDTIGEVAPA